MLGNLHFSNSEWNRHHRHPRALCRQGNMHQMVKLGLCTRADYTKSMSCVKGAKRRNEFWKMLGYPNLARARRRKNTRAGAGSSWVQDRPYGAATTSIIPWTICLRSARRFYDRAAPTLHEKAPKIVRVAKQV